jgi:hypothetical protein
MPGSKSASSSPLPWDSIALEEVGGFAGLRRGVALPRTGAKGKAAKRIPELLAALEHKATAGAQGSRQLPDSQTLSLHVEGPTGTWDASFDTADLPAEVAELLTYVPPLRPLPFK